MLALPHCVGLDQRTVRRAPGAPRSSYFLGEPDGKGRMCRTGTCLLLHASSAGVTAPLTPGAEPATSSGARATRKARLPASLPLQPLELSAHGRHEDLPGCENFVFVRSRAKRRVVALPDTCSAPSVLFVCRAVKTKPERRSLFGRLIPIPNNSVFFGIIPSGCEWEQDTDSAA